MTTSDEDAFEATLKVIKKRIGCAWLINEQEQEEDRVLFDSLDYAKAAANRGNGDFSNSWLCNHFSLDVLLAKHIHEYVALPPKSVFFFEEGDLWIEVIWDSDHRDSCEGYLIARRRKEGPGSYLNKKQEDT
jgi:hypothetical protein